MLRTPGYLHYAAIAGALVSVAAVSALPVLADDAVAAATEHAQPFTLDIAAQSLAKSLTALATATGTQISASSSVLDTLSGPALKGEFSIEQALSALLNGTGLVAVAAGPHSYIIQAEKSATAVQLDNQAVYGSYLPREQLNSATGLGLKPQETPQSVTIFTAQRIEDQSLSTVAQAVTSATGVTTQELDDVRNTFMSRGYEVTNYQVDGVPLSWSLAGDSGETIADVSLYERIEIVRGATGLLTGAGDPSASINLVRKRADSRELTGKVSVSAGNWEQKSVQADVGSGLNESGSVRGRVVAKYSEKESFQDLYKDDRTVLYTVVEADLSDNTQLRAGVSYDENNPSGVSWGSLPAWYSDGSKADWDVSKTTSADWTHWETTGTNYFASLDHTLDNGWLVSANYNRLVYTQATKLLYLYGSVDKDTGEGLYTWPINSYGVSVQNSLDLHLTGDFTAFGQVHEFTLGALQSKQNANTKEYAELSYPASGNFYEWDGSVAEPAWDTTATTNVDMETTQTGIYAATRLSLSDELKVIAGARVSSWNREGYNYGDVDFGDNNVLVPYIGALYDLNENHRIYLSHTGIFNPQSERDVNGDTLDPTQGSTEELGLKSSFLNDTLQTSVALFYTRQDNLALATGETVNGNPTEQAYAGDLSTSSKGFEFEVVGEPADGWNLNLGFTRFIAEDENGDAINTEHANMLANLFSTYEMGKMTLGGGVDWQGKTYGDGGSDQLVQGSFALVNLMGRYQFNPAFSAQVNLNNLLDEKYYSQIGFYSQYRYGAPRNGSLSLNYAF
ncbi:TonB-dependent siderophore receptor [Thalassolituus sp. LLYu03]|uniref:TonB-dependent siderophore receptor n=1 Tax=Thalassolituus sp. LLYu03 TaxID=3421656 RepID=UPI003D2994DD